MWYANTDNTFCTWNNRQYMVCQYAHSIWSSTILFGAFGTNNMFKLYPILPWCFLLGAILGVAWIVGEKFLPRVRLHFKSRTESESFGRFDKYFWEPAASTMACLNPAIALSGALKWAGNQNLSYATLQMYLAFVFQWYLKRRYTAWWGKYAYLIWAGLSVGVAIAGLITTLVFGFGAGQGVDFSWWGNNVAREGMDFQLYNNNATLYAIPKDGFGLLKDQYPTGW
ncbi:hypothetical protein V2G26_014944 [Clonostachys chloroleuca]